MTDRPALQAYSSDNQKVLPGLRLATQAGGADLYMERWTFDSQVTNKPLRGRPDNLYQPVLRDGGERGRNWVGHTRKSSVYTRAVLHPGASVAMIAALALGLGAAAARHRGASSSGN